MSLPVLLTLQKQIVWTEKKYSNNQEDVGESRNPLQLHPTGGGTRDHKEKN